MVILVLDFLELSEELNVQNYSIIPFWLAFLYGNFFSVSISGHTAGCMTYVLHEAGLVFTGDALLIRGCGRTDFQGGSSDVLYDSIHKQIFTLPDNFFVFPAHNYVGMTMSTVGEEKNYNSR